MNLKLRLISAFRSLKHHKMRSLLTTLGIIIGVVAIIAVMSIGEGAKYKIRKEIEKMGSNFIITLAAPPKMLGGRGGPYFTLKPGDAQTIRDECKDIYLFSPAVMYSTKTVTEGASWQTFVFGVNNEYPEVGKWVVEKGMFFTEQEVRANAKVAVLGQRVAKELFGEKEAIGAIVRIKKIPFKVIGVLAEKGRSPDGRDLDDVIMAPLTTVQRKLLGKTNYTAFTMSTYDQTKMPIVARQVRSILRQRHRLAENEEDDFTIFTQADALQASDAATAIMNLLLFVIASISLIVGGIGIMNIMLVTVSERTKEIGIRMALGATTNSILSQFILEAITICLIGGLLGASLGIGVAEIVGYALGWPIVISQKAVLISLSSAALIGLFFGYYPALKASKLNPVEALIEH